MSRLLPLLTFSLVLVTVIAARRLDDDELSSKSRRNFKDEYVKHGQIARKERKGKDAWKSEFIGLLNMVAKFMPSTDGPNQTSTTDPSTTESYNSSSYGSSQTSTAKPSATNSGSFESNLSCGELPSRDIIIPKRIVGGAEAQAHDWPSICSLQVFRRHRCGATLVKNNKGRYYAISAAHCMFFCTKYEGRDCVGEKEPISKRWLSVVCGIHNVKQGDTPDFSQTFYIDEYINHEDYNKSGTFPHQDITILELNHQPFENQHVQAACLASTDHHKGEPSMVAGWGMLEEDGQTPDVLHELYKPIDSDKYCEMIYGEIGLNNDKHQSMCAGHREGGKDSCQGDSGGPLYTRRNNKWTLTGIVSWGDGCGKTDFVGVYADVYSLRDWIDSKINE